MRDAKGIAFVTVIKGGYIFSGTVGSGIVLAKLPNGIWCKPDQPAVRKYFWSENMLLC